METTIKDGIETRKTEIPDGFEIVKTFHPHSTPWDYHGNKFLIKFKRILNDYNPISIVTHQRIINQLRS